jgi:hypothetical protein
VHAGTLPIPAEVKEQHMDEPTPARRWTGPRRATNPTRDRTISRLAVLKAAAAFGASRPDLKSADVLKIAECWLRWVQAS